MIGGFVVMGAQNRHTRAVVQETRRRRLNVACLLQAEEDRRFLRELHERYEVEGKVMAGRPDWTVGESPYHNKDRYVLPIHVEKKN